MPLFNPAAHWLAPVSTFGDLPVSGNETGDSRVVLADNLIYTWNGSAWVSPGANASIVLTPATNNLGSDSEISSTVPAGGSVPLCPAPVEDGDGSFTIQDALDLANTNGIGKVQLSDGVFILPASNSLQMYPNVELVGNGSGTVVASRPSLALLPSLVNGGTEPATGVFVFKNAVRVGATNRALAVTPAKNENVSLLQVSPAVAAFVSEDDWIEYEDQFRRVQRKYDDTGVSGNWFLILNAHVRLTNTVVPAGSFNHYPASDFMENAWAKNFKLKLFADGWAATYLSGIEFENAAWSGFDNVIYEGDEFGPGSPNYPSYGMWSAIDSHGIAASKGILEKSAVAWCYGSRASFVDVVGNTLNNHSGDDGFGGDNPQWNMWLDPGCDQWNIENNRVEIGIDSSVYNVGLLYHASNNGFETIRLHNNSWTASGIVNGTFQESEGLVFDGTGNIQVTGDTINAGSADVLVGGLYTIRVNGPASAEQAQEVLIEGCKLAPSSGFSGATDNPSIAFHSLNGGGGRRYQISNCQAADFQKGTALVVDAYSCFVNIENNQFDQVFLEGTAGGHATDYNLYSNSHNTFFQLNSSTAAANVTDIHVFGGSLKVDPAVTVSWSPGNLWATNCAVSGDWDFDDGFIKIVNGSLSGTINVNVGSEFMISNSSIDGAWTIEALHDKYLITNCLDGTSSLTDNSGLGVIDNLV